MKNYLGRVVRLGIVPLLLFLGFTTGGADGLVGWFVLAWMLFRGGPGMWRDVRGFFGWLSSGRLRSFLVRGRRASGRQDSLTV